MSVWTSYEINKIAPAEELQIMSRRFDGTLGDATTIWVVRVRDDLYVRPVRGRKSVWFRATQALHEGTIQAGGIEKEVSMVEVNDAEINDQIDAAYWAKYERYGEKYVGPVVSPQARSATIKLLPRLIRG